MTAFKCDGCGRRDFISAPMLHDEVWLKLADKHETLCDECMWRRERKRHVTVTLDSLKPCPINLGRGWFDLYARHENAPPENIAEWQALARDIGVICRRDCQPHQWLIERAEMEAIRAAHSKWLEDELAKEKTRLEERLKAHGVQLSLPLDNEAKS
jgi:hypothetical protein